MKKRAFAIILAAILSTASYAFCQVLEEGNRSQAAEAVTDETLSDTAVDQKAASYENDIMLDKEKVRAKKIANEGTYDVY